MSPTHKHASGRIVRLGLCACGLLLAAAGQEQQPSTGINWRGYNVQESTAVGARSAVSNGSAANYDTLVNLQSGARLYDFSLGMRSLQPAGGLFDSLSLSGFGLGGDPNTVVRLQAAKGRWYRFDATYRHDRYFFGYNLLANPLNPASSNPALPVTTALHNLDYARRMGDYHLTLLPEGRFHIRLGYSHLAESGPSFTTVGASMAPAVAEVGTTTPLFQGYATSTDLYRAGFDYLVARRTRVSFTEVVQHTKGDTAIEDQNLLYQLSNGTPLDLGVVFNTGGGTPCAAPIANPATTPATANPACQGLIAYTGDQRPRLTMPTEQFGFQSGYFSKLALEGLFSYSSGVNSAANSSTAWAGLNTRLGALGNRTNGQDRAKRVLVDGDLAAVYQITPKLRLSDDSSYNSFRLPTQFGFAVLNQFAQGGGAITLLSPPAVFSAASCPAPYTAATCPQHTSSAPADAAQGTALEYLGQNLATETVQIGYNFSPRWGGQVGYRYTYRSIYDYAAVDYAAETFDPGGATGARAAARGDCALPKGGSFPASLPAGCALQADGAVVFSGLTPASDANHLQAVAIHGNSVLASGWAQPTPQLRINAGVEAFTADQAYTRITPRQWQHYTARAQYQPIAALQLSASGDALESRDNVAEVNNRNHNRNVGFAATLSPRSSFALDLSYNYNNTYTQALVCYAFTPAAAGASACPIAGSPVGLGSLSTYSDQSHFVNADLMVQPMESLTLRFGVASSFVNGVPLFFNLSGAPLGNFLNPLTPWGPLRFNYQQPYLSLNYAMTPHLSYRVDWHMYNYFTHGNQSPAGLAPLGGQNFDASDADFSIRFTM